MYAGSIFSEDLWYSALLALFGIAPFAVLLVGRWVVRGAWAWGPRLRVNVPKLPVLVPVRQSTWLSASRSRWLMVGALSGAIPSVKQYYHYDLLSLFQFYEYGMLTSIVGEALVGSLAGMGLALAARRFWFGPHESPHF